MCYNNIIMADDYDDENLEQEDGEGRSNLYNAAQSEWLAEATGKKSASRELTAGANPENENKKSLASRDARDTFLNAEKSAERGGRMKKTAERAETATSYVSNVKGKGATETATVNGKKGKNGKKKAGLRGKKGVLVVIVILLVVFAGTSFISQSFQGFSFSQNVILKKDTSSAVIEDRLKDILAYQLNPSDEAIAMEQEMGTRNYELSDYMLELFAEHNLVVIPTTLADGTTVRVLAYQEPSTNTIAAVTKTTADRAELMTALAAQTGSSVVSLDTNLNVFGVADASAATSLEDSYFEVARIIANSSWHDATSDAYVKRLGQDRTKYNADAYDADKTAIQKSEQNKRLTEQGTMSSDSNSSDECEQTIVHYGTQVQVGTDEETGEPIYETEETGTQTTKVCKKINKKTGEETVEETVTPETPPPGSPIPGRTEHSKVPESLFDEDLVKEREQYEGTEYTTYVEDALIERLTKVAAQNQNIGTWVTVLLTGNIDRDCAAAKAATSTNAVVYSIRRAQSVNAASSYLIAIQKAQAGDGGTEMNYYQNLANIPVTQTDDSGNTTKKAMTESDAFNTYFSDDYFVSEDDPFVYDYSTEKTLHTAFDSGATSADAYKYCTNENKQAIHYTDIAGLLSSSQKSDFTEEFESAGKASDFTADIWAAIRDAIGWNDTVKRVIDNASPEINKALQNDPLTDFGGENTAVAINNGIDFYVAGQLRQTSGTFGNESEVIATYTKVNERIARTATYDQRNLSPFDTSSNYTFLGSLLTTLTPVASHLHSFSSFLSSAASTVSSSFFNIIPSASALTADQTAKLAATLKHDCYFSADDSVDMVATVECVNIPAHNMTHINTPYEEIVTKMKDGGYITDDLKPVAESEYDYWLHYCTQSESAINNYDFSFMEPTKNNLNKVDEDYGFLRTKKSCGGNHEKTDLYALFSQFTLDNRIIALANGTGYSTVAAYLNDYYVEHPIDESYEGLISRYSGLPKEEVVAYLETAKYWDEIASYDPTTRYQFDEAPTPAAIFFESTSLIADLEPEFAKKLKEVVYQETRYRNFAA